MPSSTRTRKDRNNPYPLDGLFGDIHRSAAGTIWRWRSEFTTAVVTGLAAYELIHLIGIILVATLLAVIGAGLGFVPHPRRFITRRFWCLVTRHRIQRLCWEARLHTRSGRLPLILWIRSTEVGERVFVWCRAGISSEDFEAHTDDIRAACYARDARVARNKQHSQLVTIDVIRRDTLHATRHVKPHIIPGVVLERTDAVTSRTRVLARRFTASIPRWLRRTPASN
jgi:hypothetical protein